MRKKFILIHRKSSLNIITILMHAIAAQKVKLLMMMEFGIVINVIMTYVHNALNETLSTLSSLILIRITYFYAFIFSHLN